ncbi:MAG: hypothetical protein ABH896_04130 [Candidatus Jacksonbacteria bacterium]
MIKTTLQPQTQITFKAPTLLKEQALNKARQEGFTLKALLSMAMREYVNDNLLFSLHSKEDYYDEIFADKEVVAKANELGTMLAKKNW